MDGEGFQLTYLEVDCQDGLIIESGVNKFKVSRVWEIIKFVNDFKYAGLKFYNYNAVGENLV